MGEREQITHFFPRPDEAEWSDLVQWYWTS